MKIKTILLMLFLEFILVGTAFCSVGVLGAENNGNDAEKRWTVMVYMDADNNLDPWAYVSMELLKRVGSTENVNVVVLWDGYSQPAYMYYVEKGNINLIGEFELNGIEVNMGDWTTLKTFVNFVVKNFPAEHYLLVMWNHGDDFTGCCWDDHPKDYLNHSEIVWALSGYKIDIMAWDACLGAMIEVAYEYCAKNLSIGYLVASENYVGFYGYPYDKILEKLVANPSMGAEELAKVIVEEYAKFYQTAKYSRDKRGIIATLSAIKIENVDEAVEKLSNLIGRLMMDIRAYRGLITAARGAGNLPWAEYGWDRYIDLPSFVKYIRDNVGDEEIKKIADDLLSTLLEDVIIAVGNTKPLKATRAMGLGIWFPPSERIKLEHELLKYENLAFAERGWLDFLKAYWRAS